MTTRGTNPSISPPVQIPQPRHVSAISSGTPPPSQQIYPGQSPGLVQGPSFNYIQPSYSQGEPLLPYQAYGSAPNELRGATASSGRGGAGPTNMAQPGPSYYHQANQNMRPSQPPPPSHPQQFYLGQPGQNSMRHTRPNHASNQAMFLIQQPNNLVIPGNVYQPPARIPTYYTHQSGPQLPPRYPGQPGMVYYNSRPTVPMQTQGMGPPPAPREKRFINISDPNTGRNITDEIMKSQHQPSDEKGEQDESSGNDKGSEIRKNFTRQVVERLKIGEASPQASVEAVNPQAQTVHPSHNQPSQEHPQIPSYPPGPPQQPQSTPPLAGTSGPGSIMRSPAMRMAGPINLSVPPPQLPSIVYSNPHHSQSQQTMPSQTSMPVQQPQQVLPTKGHPHPSASTVAMADPPAISRPVESIVSHEVSVTEQQPQSVLQAKSHVLQSASTVVSESASSPTPVEPSDLHESSASEGTLLLKHSEPIIPQSDIPPVQPSSASVAPVQPSSASVAPVQQVEKPALVPVTHSQPSFLHSPKTLNPAEDANISTTAVTRVTTAPITIGAEQSAPLLSQVSAIPIPPVVPVSSSQPAVLTPPMSTTNVKDEQQSPVVDTSKSISESVKLAETETCVSVKEEIALGASIQVNKDGKKGKKGKKDFGRKESGGSDMDAFIDSSDTTTNNDSAPVDVTDKGKENTVDEITTKDECISLKQVTKMEKLSTSLQVENKSKVKKKKKKKGKKSAPSVKAKTEEPDGHSEKNSDTPSELKVCQNESVSSPCESHSSEARDSGVDSEVGPPISDVTTEVQSQDRADVNTPPIASKNVEPPVVNEQEVNLPIHSLAVNPPVEQADGGKANIDETETVRPDIEKNQNGTQLLSEGRLKEETKTSVPKDDNNSVPEIPVEKSNDAPQSETDEQLPEENGTPQIEELEVSKAETFAKLKKSGGKLVYDRAYLMELRGCISSQTKPDGLPQLEVILDRPDPTLSRPSGGPADFTPAFFQTVARHAPPIGKSSSRGRQRPGDITSTPRVIKSISLSSETKNLHQAENPWKPFKKDEKEEKTLEGEILFIMNRLTPTNFDRMAEEMKRLGIKTYEDLQFMVKVFFDKVTIETKFVEAYALLCKVMAGLKVPPPGDGTVKEHMATFRVVMLTKCQQEFEADKSIVFENPEEKRKKLEAEFPEKTPERDEKIDQTLYHMKLKRMKFYGNIRFIGELFKLGMLTESIMHDCIFRLLKARDDDSLVSLCNLLTTVGRNLDTDKAKPRMDQYFSQMTKISDERKSRIKFTLKDIIDLRQCNWVPRKEATGPKKIDEVHKDFAQEQARNQYLASQPLPSRNDSAQAGSRRGSRQRQDERPNDDGWNTVSSKSVRMIDASKMKISKNVVDDNIQLGPGGGVHRQTIWSRGSHGGAQPSQDERQSVGSNRFSALTNDDSRRSFPRSPSRGEGSAARSLRQGPTAGHGRGKIMTRSSQEGDRRQALSNIRSFTGGRSQNSSRDNSWNRDDRRQLMGPRSSWERDNPMTRSDSAVRIEEFRVPAPVQPAVKQMAESEIETKATNILDEYLNIRDLEEAKLCVKELIGQNHIHLVVTACINNVLEKRDDARHMTGSLFHELVSSNIITSDIFTKGLNDVLEFAVDMVVDIPTLWNCIAHVICPLLVGGSLPWSKLKPAMTPYLDNKHGAKLLAAILSQCVEKQGEREVFQHWQKSNLNWSSYLKPDELKDFVADRKLNFTLGDSKPSGTGLDIFADLERMIRDRASSANEIISFIEKSVPGSKTDSSFIRALTTAVVSSAISDRKIDVDVIKSHKDVLQRYISNKVDLQLQALYAIQILMAKLEHPSGALVILFEFLYYDCAVEEEAFYRWEKCSDPLESEGKGPCLMSARQFFIWLRENEEPES